MTRALVTGCAGFIGSHLTESLLEGGAEVVGLDCFNDNYGRAQKLANLKRARSWDNFDFVPIDLARGELHEYVTDCDVVYHLAAEPGVRLSWGSRFETYVRNNVLATQQVLEAAKSRPGLRVVFASSSSVYGQAESFPTAEDARPRPRSPYGVTKLTAEHLCGAYHDDYGVDAVVLRYFSVYGPRQRPDMAFNIFCAAALHREPIRIFGDGTQTRDFTFVGDIVDATRSAATCIPSPHRLFNVGGGARTSLKEVVDLLGEFSGHRLEVEYRTVQHGDVRDTCADTTRARAQLGVVGRVPLVEGLRTQFEWAAAHEALGGVR